MLLILKEVVEQCNFINIYDETLVICINNNLYIGEKVFKFNALLININSKKDIIVGKGVDWSNFIINLENEHVIEIEDHIILNGNFEKNILLNCNSHLGLYNFYDNTKFITKIKFESKLESYLERDGALFLAFENSIKYLLYQSDVFFWERNLLDIYNFDSNVIKVNYKITKIFGIINKTLCLSIEYTHLVGLSMDNGSVLHHFSINDLLPPENKYRWLFPHFDEDAGTISYCESNAYFVLDLKTFKVIDFHSFIIPDKSKQWTIVSCTMDDDFVYFNGNLGGSFFSPSAVGIFDRHKKEVVWYEDLKLYEQDQYRFINHPPQYGGGKLYVHDSKGTLYIYEREDL